MRMYEKVFPSMYKDSKYAYRLPIGTMEVVDNFPYQALRDYYEKWYRPDQQGIVVVGDINVDSIEVKIKKLFSPIEMPPTLQNVNISLCPTMMNLSLPWQKTRNSRCPSYICSTNTM